MKRPAVILLALAAAYFGIAAYGRHREAQAQRARDAVVFAVDDLWLQAVDWGAPRERLPEIEFRASVTGSLAVTYCEQPRPRIVFDEAQLARFPWYVHTLAIPHELAHVMVCLEGDPAAWREQHGDAWQSWVHRLVPHDRAEEILAEQAVLNRQGVTP